MLFKVGWNTKTGSRLTIWPPLLNADRKIQSTGEKKRRAMTQSNTW
jgi:hypothetical protein